MIRHGTSFLRLEMSEDRSLVVLGLGGEKRDRRGRG